MDKKPFPSLNAHPASTEINVSQRLSVPPDRLGRKLERNIGEESGRSDLWLAAPLKATPIDSMTKGMRVSEGDREMAVRLISHFSLTFRVVMVSAV